VVPSSVVDTLFDVLGSIISVPHICGCIPAFATSLPHDVQRFAVWVGSCASAVAVGVLYYSRCHPWYSAQTCNVEFSLLCLLLCPSRTQMMLSHHYSGCPCPCTYIVAGQHRVAYPIVFLLLSQYSQPCMNRLSSVLRTKHPFNTISDLEATDHSPLSGCLVASGR